MDDKEFLRFLRNKTTDELLEVLDFRKTIVLFCSDRGSAPALVAKSERLCGLIKSELSRRSAFDEPRVIARLTAHSVKFWRPFTEEDYEWFRELAEDLGEGSSD
jgi:hypothetical protein